MGFGIYDRPSHLPDRRPRMAVAAGRVAGLFKVTPSAIVLQSFLVQTDRSRVRTTVTLGFNDFLGVDVFDGSRIDLSDVSPIAGLALGGELSLRASLAGRYSDPRLTGELAAKRFSIAGFDVGDIESAKVEFRLLDLLLRDARIRHTSADGRASLITARELSIDFDSGPPAIVEADLAMTESPHLWLSHLFSILRLDRNPVWNDLKALASGTARVRFVAGGGSGGGSLRVRSPLELERAEVFGERFQDGRLELELDWDMGQPGVTGLAVAAESLVLRKAGGGLVLGRGGVLPGGVVSASLVGSGVPIGEIDLLTSRARALDASVGLVGDVFGTLDDLRGAFDVQVSPLRIGPASLPASRLSIAMRPDAFGLAGNLFGGQVRIDALTIGRGLEKVVRDGAIELTRLDLGALSNLIPGVAFVQKPPRGFVSASIGIDSLPLSSLSKAKMGITLREVELSRAGASIELRRVSAPIALAGDRLSIPRTLFRARSALGLTADVDIDGIIDSLSRRPTLDIDILAGPLDLSALPSTLPSVSRIAGSLVGTLHLSGPFTQVGYDGLVLLRGGSLRLRSTDVAIDDVMADLVIQDGEIRLEDGRARVGSSRSNVELSGAVPIDGFSLGDGYLDLQATGVRAPIADGITLTAGAQLHVDAPRDALPNLTGSVEISDFEYTRPIGLSLDIGQFVGRARRTEVEAVDPDGDVVAFDLTVTAPAPLKVSNNLVDLQVDIEAPGLRIEGTNQRYGAQGTLTLAPAGKLKLRQNEFEVREGTIRFDDPDRINPRVDVRAGMELRRYASSSQGGGSLTSVQQSASLGGVWTIGLLATGALDDLSLRFSSDPALSQDDILLLLTTGLTRAELDRGLATSLGETVGLEALSSLTGIDRAVRNTVPLIDEFRFGSNYSTRSGRTEPTVTLGKRITDNLRANVTTTVTENREVRSSIEWRIDPRFSVQGAYDNVNDASGIGNLGADLRFRLDFE